MLIKQLSIKNFRGIKSANFIFDGHTLIVGRNNVGKSTICEALELLLGPDRLNQSSPIDEYDFYNAVYLAEDGKSVPILIEAVLTDLSEKSLSRFARYLEFWHCIEKRLLTTGEIETTNESNVKPCLRLLFKGEYDPDEDEFKAKTFYSHSPDEENEEKLTDVSRSAKREIGFLYLRALRTGSRALSLERGSLLDTLLRIGQFRPHLWENTRRTLLNLAPPVDGSIGALRSVLDNIEERIKQYISLESESKPTRLFVSQLTREHLRKTVSFFMSTAKDQSPIPFHELGTGTLNILVFALLSAIAELKKDDVIFAMEEPEIAIPPHTQRRIINYLLENTSQSFVTSHSPYIIEKFAPEQIIILRRDTNANVTSTFVTLESGIKPKLFQRKLRHSIAEAILGQAVIIGEGLVEQQVLTAAMEIMEGADNNNYPFDLSGISFFTSDGDGSLWEYGSFFRSLGLKTFAFYDKKNRSDDDKQKIASSFDINIETIYKGIEELLSSEIPIEIQWKYLESLSSSNTVPHGVVIPLSQPYESEVRKLTRKILVDKKGDSRASELVKMCTIMQIPNTIKSFLESIYSQYPKPTEINPIQLEENNSTNLEPTV